MKFIPREITLTNFKTFRGTHTIKLDLGAGLHFVKGKNGDEPRLGSNGAGKSSIFDALCWVLFGRSVDGLRTDDLVPWEVDCTIEVSLAFDDGEAEHTITRATTAEGGLRFDNQAISQQSLEAKIGFTLLTFKHAILRGQGEPLFANLQPRDKMQVLAEALMLDRWEDRSELASKRAKEIKSTIDELMGTINTQRDTLAEITAQRESLGREHDDWEKNQFKKMLEDKAQLKEYEKRYSSVDLKQDKLRLDADAAATEAKASKQEVEQFTVKLADLKNEKNRLHSDIGALDDALGLLKGKKCPTCGQPLHSAAEYKEELSSRRARARKEQQFNERDYDYIKAKLAKASEELKAFSNAAERARDALEFVQPEHVELKTKIENTKKWLKEHESARNPFEEQLDKIKHRKTKLAEELEVNTKKFDRLQVRHARVSFWIKGFKDVRLFIIEDVLQELEMCSNVLLEQFGLIGWEMHYDVEKETKSGTVQRGINISILSPRNRQAVRFECWSGGEAQRLTLISALALSEVLLDHAGVETGIEIFDEPTQHLSGEGRFDLCEMLALRSAQTSRAILLADHTVIESALFRSTITVTRDERGSQVTDNERKRLRRA